jgi:DHA2 family multidrug resistance protein
MARPHLASQTAMAAIDGEVTRQASMVSYVDVFHLMFLATLAAIPLVLLLRKPADQIADADAMLNE